MVDTEDFPLVYQQQLIVMTMAMITKCTQAARQVQHHGGSFMIFSYHDQTILIKDMFMFHDDL